MKGQVSRGRLILFCVFVALQVVVPLVQLPRPRAARFGWQMFAGARPWPTFFGRGPDGRLAPIAVERYLGNPRGDLDVTPGVWRQLCSLLPEIRAIQVIAADRLSEEHRCP
jgi:hypothetical protein